MKSFVVCCYLSFCLTACVGGDKGTLIEAVTSYDAALAQAYDRGDIMLLKEVTTDQQLRRVDKHLTILNSSGQLMRSRLLKQKITKAIFTISNGKKEGLVEATEKWEYEWVDSRTGVVTVPRTETSYCIAYHLTNDNNRWLVNAADAVEEKEVSR